MCESRFWCCWSAVGEDVGGHDAGGASRGAEDAEGTESVSERCAKGHITIRLPYQPCPHPECWSDGDRLTEVLLPQSVGIFEESAPVTHRYSIRRRYHYDGVDVWAWCAREATL